MISYFNLPFCIENYSLYFIRSPLCCSSCLSSHCFALSNSLTNTSNILYNVFISSSLLVLHVSSLSALLHYLYLSYTTSFNKVRKATGLRLVQNPGSMIPYKIGFSRLEEEEEEEKEKDDEKPLISSVITEKSDSIVTENDGNSSGKQVVTAKVRELCHTCCLLLFTLICFSSYPLILLSSSSLAHGHTKSRLFYFVWFFLSFYALHCIALFCFALYCIVLYCFVLPYFTLISSIVSYFNSVIVILITCPLSLPYWPPIIPLFPFNLFSHLILPFIVSFILSSPFLSDAHSSDIRS